jgi:hypothetical protein
MTQSHCTYSIESIQTQLANLDLPFAEHFARALVGLISGRCISLHHVSARMPGETDAEANRQQLRRCLDHESLTCEAWARAIATLLPQGKWVLALDRTEWKRGDTTINLLVLAVVIYGSAVPLLWTVMPACGASDTAERIELLGRFVALFGKEKVLFLTADREFIGAAWISWLLTSKLPFRIRVKANTMLTHEDRAEQPAVKWFGKRSCRCKSRPMEIWGLPVFVGGKKLKTKDRKGNTEFLVIISNEKSHDLWEDYKQRWKIETLFQALKGRGFGLESCRLSKENRLSGWFGFLALGLCWCLKVGRLLDEIQPLPLKNHGRRAVSTFQRGLRELQLLLDCLSGRPDQQRFQTVLRELEAVK